MMDTELTEGMEVTDMSQTEEATTVSAE